MEIMSLKVVNLVGSYTFDSTFFKTPSIKRKSIDDGTNRRPLTLRFSSLRKQDFSSCGERRSTESRDR